MAKHAKTLLVRSFDEIQNIKTMKWQFVYVLVDKYIHLVLLKLIFSKGRIQTNRKYITNFDMKFK